MTSYPSTAHLTSDDRVPLASEPATTSDVTEGGAIGAVGGAVVGGLAGGPIGAVAGAIIGAVASAAAINVVDREDGDFSPIDEFGDTVAQALAAPIAPVNTYTGADYRGVDKINADSGLQGCRSPNG